MRRRVDDGTARRVVFDATHRRFHVSVEVIDASLWIVATWPRGDRALLRAAFAPDGVLDVLSEIVEECSVRVALTAGCGRFEVAVNILDDDEPTVWSRTRFTSVQDTTVTDWPRDLIILGPAGTVAPADGSLDLEGSGLCASMLQLRLERSGSLFYFQNLSELGTYAEATKVSMAGTVGGEWPEVGFALPSSAPGRFLPAGKEIVISDAFLRLSTRRLTTPATSARQYLANLSAVYVHLPRPELTYHDWLGTSEAVLADLENGVGCWAFVAGQRYVNAYLSDGETPPELMVQLAVLMPLLDYARTTGATSPAIEELRATLPTFFDPKLGAMRRWLPSRDDELDGSEEHKFPWIMDSWYMHHALVNIGRLARRRDRGARRLFFDSLEYLITAAHRFKYDWPIFFHIETLEVRKAESAPGAGGETDVPGMYAHVMLQAWEMTGEQRYLDEAIRAGRALLRRGFAIFYQANVTAFGALAMFRLWKITGEKRFLDTCYMCVANVFANMWLWDCDYGYGRHYTTFLASLPVKHAPYIASYEEQEVCAAFATLLTESANDDELAPMTLLLSEFIRRLGDRAWFSYPRNLPADVLPDRPKTGELCRDLWIPLEDIRDGWDQSGAVGQEVYGAGLALGVVSRHYHRVQGAEWTIYAQSLIKGPTMTGRRSLRFTVLGDPRVQSHVRILGEELPHKLVATARFGARSDELPMTAADGCLEFVVHGRQDITLRW